MKKTTKVLALSAALAAAGIGSAQANSFAEAYINITNFRWINTGTGAALVNGTDLDIAAAGQNSASANGNINADTATSISCNSQVTGTTTGGCTSGFGQHGPGGAILFNSTSAGPDGVAMGAASPNPPANPVQPVGNLTYSYGSYALSGAVVDLPGLGPGGSTIAAGVSAESLAQVDAGTHVDPVDGNAASNIGSNTNFTFTAASTLSTRFVMDYSTNFLASIVAPSGAGDNANAGSSWTLTLTDKGTDGNGNTLAALFQPGFLNTSVGVGAGQSPNHASSSATDVALQDALHGGSTTFSLQEGHIYNFSITSQRFAFLHQDLPEPDTLALFGIGMIGVVASAVRKRKSPSA